MTSGEKEHPPPRPIEELLRTGVMNIDKPQGPSSHQVTAWIKNIFGVEKAGHGGTLDPNVTGVLPVALLDATKALYALLQGDKEYVCAMKLHKDVQPERVRWVLKDFVGDIFQTPPLRSAVKKEMRIRRVHELEVLEMEERDVLFRVRCEAGTYVRTLCTDVGDALCAGAHMEGLRRTRAVNFREDGCVTLQDVRDAYEHWKETGDENHLRKAILPMESLLEHLPKVLVRDTAVDSICHGADLAIPGIANVNDKVKKGDLVAMMTVKGEGIAVGVALLKSDDMLRRGSGKAIDTKRVLMKRGTYPKSWKPKSKSLNLGEKIP
ncbi:MAG: RNA-guided pseudouridylation complex pseudouridine synthase subunit Cbf5 [Thermoplasmata archaeon]|nr:RNA-guided pseudouridylation complex pseudouridine synthase subunit Cbf5 [Thermoplasmata archaeon]